MNDPPAPADVDFLLPLYRVRDAVVQIDARLRAAARHAAHHDHLDDELIYPSHETGGQSTASALLSGCLLVVVAALDCPQVRGGADRC